MRDRVRGRYQFRLGVAVLRLLMRSLGRSTPALRTFIHGISVVHLFIYRVTRGSVSARLGLRDAFILLLTTTGRRTGKPRTVPLLGIGDRDRIVIVASHGGLDQAPTWWLNLQANPAAVVQIGRRVLRVTATQAGGQEHRRLWARFAEEFPGYVDYQNRTAREIPIMILQTIDDPRRSMTDAYLSQTCE